MKYIYDALLPFDLILSPLLLLMPVETLSFFNVYGAPEGTWIFLKWVLHAHVNVSHVHSKVVCAHVNQLCVPSGEKKDFYSDESRTCSILVVFFSHSGLSSPPRWHRVRLSSTQLYLNRAKNNAAVSSLCWCCVSLLSDGTWIWSHHESNC